MLPPLLLRPSSRPPSLLSALHPRTPPPQDAIISSPLTSNMPVEGSLPAIHGSMTSLADGALLEAPLGCEGHMLRSMSMPNERLLCRDDDDWWVGGERRGGEGRGAGGRPG